MFSNEMSVIKQSKIIDSVKVLLDQMPNDWLRLTTHRLDIYVEKLAKTAFLEQLESLVDANNITSASLSTLPTAFDYIRLGHPLSCLLEWSLAKINHLSADKMISFSSKTAPILAVLRKNLFENKKTLISYKGQLPKAFIAANIKAVYAYQFELLEVEDINAIPSFEGSTIYVNETNSICEFELNSNIDFAVQVHPILGSVIAINGEQNAHYKEEIQHVRRRETIAMTPSNTQLALQQLVDQNFEIPKEAFEENKIKVISQIHEITASSNKAVVGSSGLSIQYAIVMGLIDEALSNHPGKDIKIIVPPNCYGGTNDQARRVADCIKQVEIVDLPVDGEHNMVQSIDLVLEKIAAEDAIPYIITEIPTNPRVEVPELEELRVALSKARYTNTGAKAIDPVFILDQTFCPNVHFLGDDQLLAEVRTLAYVSGSKFPSGGKCTAGYCTANTKAASLMDKIDLHLQICDNEATALQYDQLAQQMPSMKQRIYDAYVNTKSFVDHIKTTLPSAKINFVSEEIALQGFTPSVFSLDLPTKGSTEQEKEDYKRAANLKLINLMINEIPDESKFCVSYGQLKGCYWTIPATSTQGTTKEGDKDYIVRVALSKNMDLDKHKAVFRQFVDSL